MICLFCLLVLFDFLGGWTARGGSFLVPVVPDLAWNDRHVVGTISPSRVSVNLCTFDPPAVTWLCLLEAYTDQNWECVLDKRVNDKIQQIEACVTCEWNRTNSGTCVGCTICPSVMQTFLLDHCSEIPSYV